MAKSMFELPVEKKRGEAWRMVEEVARRRRRRVEESIASPPGAGATGGEERWRVYMGT